MHSFDVDVLVLVYTLTGVNMVSGRAEEIGPSLDGPLRQSAR